MNQYYFIRLEDIKDTVRDITGLPDIVLIETDLNAENLAKYRGV